MSTVLDIVRGKATTRAGLKCLAGVSRCIKSVFFHSPGKSSAKLSTPEGLAGTSAASNHPSSISYRLCYTRFLD
ncbi:hypothetical protein RB195_002867 [Necator americanus]|uniref:Uncharacterized protein n=1 Tax=Necator americanus TaxID=51031 RepID=A0ABR1DL24_NECAM